MPFNIEGINSETFFNFLDKFCLFVTIISIPIIIDVIYFHNFMDYIFYNFNTLIIIGNYFLFYYLSSYLKKLINRQNILKFLENFCDINIKISSFLYKINQDIIYINILDNRTILIYYIISGLQFLCIVNVFLVLFLFSNYFNYFPGKYLENNNCICSICLENKNNWILPCKHSFHKECIMEWFKSKNSCPLCRESFQ